MGKGKRVKRSLEREFVWNLCFVTKTRIKVLSLLEPTDFERSVALSAAAEKIRSTNCFYLNKLVANTTFGSNSALLHLLVER